MKIALISDIHANLEALTAVLRDLEAQRVDRIICLGDVVGYNADPEECVRLIRETGALCVAGNHDRAVAGQISTDDFSETAARGVAWTRRKLSTVALEFLAELPSVAQVSGQVIVVHGALHPETAKESVRLDTDERRRLSLRALVDHHSGARICAFGHTHAAGIYPSTGGTVEMREGEGTSLSPDAHYLVNPGTVGQPRNQDRRASYMTIDTAAYVLTLHQVEYDWAAARDKTRRAGLLPRTQPRTGFLPGPLREGFRKAARSLGVYEALKRRLR